MTDSNPLSFEQYWHAHSETVASIFDAIRESETWCLDTPNSEIERECEQLEAVIAHVSPDKIGIEHLSTMLAHLCIGRAMWMMRHFNQVDEDFIVNFTTYAEALQHDDSAANVGLSRLRLLAQLQLISQIFAPDRVQLMDEAVDFMENQYNAYD